MNEEADTGSIPSKYVQLLVAAVKMSSAPRGVKAVAELVENLDKVEQITDGVSQALALRAHQPDDRDIPFDPGDFEDVADRAAQIADEADAASPTDFQWPQGVPTLDGPAEDVRASVHGFASAGCENTGRWTEERERALDWRDRGEGLRAVARSVEVIADALVPVAELLPTIGPIFWYQAKMTAGRVRLAASACESASKRLGTHLDPVAVDNALHWARLSLEAEATALIDLRGKVQLAASELSAALQRLREASRALRQAEQATTEARAALAAARTKLDEASRRAKALKADIGRYQKEIAAINTGAYDSHPDPTTFPAFEGSKWKCPKGNKWDDCTGHPELKKEYSKHLRDHDAKRSDLRAAESKLPSVERTRTAASKEVEAKASDLERAEEHQREATATVGAVSRLSKDRFDAWRALPDMGDIEGWRAANALDLRGVSLCAHVVKRGGV